MNSIRRAETLAALDSYSWFLIKIHQPLHRSCLSKKRRGIAPNLCFVPKCCKVIASGLPVSGALSREKSKSVGVNQRALSRLLKSSRVFLIPNAGQSPKSLQSLIRISSDPRSSQKNFKVCPRVLHNDPTFHLFNRTRWKVVPILKLFQARMLGLSVQVQLRTIFLSLSRMHQPLMCRLYLKRRLSLSTAKNHLRRSESSFYCKSRSDYLLPRLLCSKNKTCL
jgi:hypothetical protein